MNKFRLAFFALLAATVLTACGTSTSGGSASYNHSGSWAGTIQDSVAGTGNVTVSMTQSGSDLAGTWQAVFASGTNGGTAIGVVNGSQVVLELYPSSASACPFNVVATRSGDTLSGNYSAFNCTGTITGTLSITKQ